MSRLAPAVCFTGLASVLVTTPAWPEAARPDAASDPDVQPTPGDGPVFRIGNGQLKIQICDQHIVRIVFASSAKLASELVSRPTLATSVKRCVPTPWHLAPSPKRGAREAVVVTGRLKVHVDLERGAVGFHDLADQPILLERRTADAGRALAPVEVQGERTFHVRQQWEPNVDEALYGLGQHQQELVNIKDHDLALRQYNTEIFIPFLVSSRGYGILWDNTSFTRFGDLSDAVPLPDVAGLYRPAPPAPPTPGPSPAPPVPIAPGSLPGVPLPGDVAIDNRTGLVSWAGSVTPRVTGDHVFRTYSAGEIKLWIDGKLVIDHFRQGWLPGEDIARVHLVAGHPVPVELKWTRDIGVDILRVLWKPPVRDRTTSLWSEVGDGVDYTFVYGPELDRVIAGYRQLTGQASLPPRFAFGLWQSRERYVNQRQSLDVVTGYRSRGIPLDNIVQDWRYWAEGQWGSHRFDAHRFPDPAAWVADLHDRWHARLMISVWPKFYAGTANFEALRAAGFLYPNNLVEQTRDFLHNVFTYYDAFNPEARRLYWRQIDEALFAMKVDAWWMDATEPEVVEGPWGSVAAQVESNATHMNPTALGTGSRMLNAYSLVNSQAIYEGQRAAAPQKRVFILTRNGFAGQQRYGAASWSGDISATWSALRKQIPAGIGFALSGMPYWTVDSGGFSVPTRFASAPQGSASLDEWRELNARWFEYATFLPLLRVHGQAPRREMWEFGGDGSPTFEAQKKFDRLRYRLQPYIYSLAGAVTEEGGTIIRPLVMDFRGDREVRELPDQYMFGPAFMVSPVTAFKVRARPVTLPRTVGGWYDFWSGAAVPAGKVQASAPFDSIPLHIRAGSIVPLGPELQYTGEKPADPITLYVYSGADGSFTLYEDDGTSTDHEHGVFARIPLRWSEARHTFTLGKREGRFTGMLARRSFQIVLVSPARPVAFSFSPAPFRTVAYAGEAIDVSLR